MNTKGQINSNVKISFKIFFINMSGIFYKKDDFDQRCPSRLRLFIPPKAPGTVHGSVLGCAHIIKITANQITAKGLKYGRLTGKYLNRSTAEEKGDIP